MSDKKESDGNNKDQELDDLLDSKCLKIYEKLIMLHHQTKINPLIRRSR